MSIFPLLSVIKRVTRRFNEHTEQFPHKRVLRMSTSTIHSTYTHIEDNKFLSVNIFQNIILYTNIYIYTLFPL